MQMTEEEVNVDDLEYGGHYVPHPAGEFRAEFTHATAEEREFDGKKKRRIRLHFQTEAEMDNGEPFGISIATAPSFHAKGKLRPFLTALGEEVSKIDPKGFFITERYGKKLRLYITQEPRKDGQGIFAKIEAFLPLKAAGTSRAAAAKQKPNFDEEDE